MKKEMHVAYHWGAIYVEPVEIYEGLSIDECVVLHDAGIKQYLLPEDDAWRTVSTTYSDARRHLHAIEQERTSDD